MSVVVAIKENDKVYMASDTMVTYGDSKRYLKTMHTQKIWNVEDTPNCIMGGVGRLSDINLIRYCSQNLIPELSVYKNELDIGVIMMNTVPQICALLKDYNEMHGKKEGTGLESSYLIGVKDHLFCIYTDGCVEEEEDYIAVGSGADAALASLSSTEGEDIYVRLLKAVHAASKISLYVGEPCIFIDNEDCEAKILSLEDVEEMAEDAEDDESEESDEDSDEETCDDAE